MNNYIAILLLAFSGSSSVLAGDYSGVPEKLFGIPLGAVFDIGDVRNREIGELPIRKSTGMSQFIHYGYNYYFQPMRDYKIFPYMETEEGLDGYYETSFRMFLFPEISVRVLGALTFRL